MLAGGLCCIGIWNARHGPRTAATLAGVGFAAFVGSHLLALAIGPWPSVLLVSALTAAATWNLADARATADAPKRLEGDDRKPTPATRSPRRSARDP